MKSRIFFIIVMAVSAFPCFSRQDAHETDKALRRQYLEQRMNDPESSVETKLRFIDELVKEYGSDVPHSLYIDKGNLLRREGRTDEALAVYNEALRHTSPDSVPACLKLLSEKTSAAIQSSHYTEGLESAYKLMSYEMPDSLLRYGILARLYLVDIYRGLRNPKNAQSYVESAEKFLENAKKRGLPKNSAEILEGKILRSEALIMLEMDNVEEASVKIELSRKLKADSIDNMITNSILSIISMRKGEFEQAEYYFRNIIDMNLPHINTMASTYYLISFLIDTGRVQEAEQLIEQYSDTLQKMKGRPFEHLYYMLFYKIAKSKGDKDRAMEWLERAYRSNDSINRTLLLLNASEVAGKYEMELRQKEFDDARLREKYKTIAIIGLVAVILSIAAWIAVLMRRQRGRRDEIEILQEKIQTIDERHSEELLETKNHLDERNKKITSMALNLAMVDAALSDIRATAADTSLSKSEALNKIQQLLKTLKIQHRSWEVFKQGFEEINPHFFEKLYRVCPNLSNAEIRMASFMLLNLPMSAVADMTNRSVRTIGTIRYNVRRKLGITGNAETWMTRLSVADDEEIERLAAIAKESGKNGPTSDTTPHAE